MTQDELKLVLEALKWCHGGEPCGTAEAIAVVEKALAQPEQEPVAWVSEDVCKGQYIDGRPRKIWWECEKGVGTAFYTTSPQRTWVDLTDDEMLMIYGQQHEGKKYSLGRMVQQALKEKNT